MFIEITKINSQGEKGKALLKTEDIVGIKENHVENEKLYDANGNVVDVVKETPKPRDFTLKLTTIEYHIDETEYQRLVSLLTK